ncbi:hypothetical protein FACS1894186_4970 [Alphaproteobacteria bacterium]|nr:hypothetical protein FACS1894186_4970 [Alphaproteobacteria bacterium]
MSLLVLPKQQVIDMSGATVAGARLYCYISGTTEAKTIYAESLMVNPLTQPVVADGAGRFPAIFWDGTPMTLVLLDSEGNEIYTSDGVGDAQETGGSADEWAQAIVSSADLPDPSRPDALGNAVQKYTGGSVYFTDVGTVNNQYLLQPLPDYMRQEDYYVGMQCYFVSNRLNSGASTVNVARYNTTGQLTYMGVKNIVRWDGSSIGAGDLRGVCQLIYNGTAFILTKSDRVELRRFCVNSSNLDINGNADILSGSGGTLSFKVGGDYPSLTGTNAQGDTGIFSSYGTVALAGTGTFTVFSMMDGSTYVSPALLAVGKTFPQSPVSGQVFYLTASIPEAFRYNGTSWETFTGFPLGYATVANGVITGVTSYSLNDDRVNLTVNSYGQSRLGWPNYAAATGYVSPPYTAPANGWLIFDQLVYYSNNTITIDGFPILFGGGGDQEGGGRDSIIAPMKLGSVATWSQPGGASGGARCRFVPSYTVEY